MNAKKVTLTLWHIFTPEEQDAKSQELVHEIERCEELEIDKKASADSFKQRIEGRQSMIRIVSHQVRERGIDRPTDCIVTFHEPAVGTKRTVRLDTGELVKEEAMTPGECQEHLFPTADIEVAVSAEEAKTAGA